MKKFVLGSVALAAMLATPAMAADMPAKARPVPLPVCYDWSGFYLGADAGWMFSTLDHTFTDAVVGSPAGATATVETNQWFVGGHGGVQYQFGCSPAGSFVIGVEGFWAVTHDSDDDKTVFATRFPGEALRANINEFGGIGIRLGYAWQNWLFTIAGGWAGADIHTGNVATAIGGRCGPPGAHCAMDTHFHHGWFVGGAVEWMVSKGPFVDAIFGLEYKYFAFEAERHCEVVTNFHCGPNGILLLDRKDVEAEIHTVKARLTIKTPGFSLFGGGAP